MKPPVRKYDAVLNTLFILILITGLILRFYQYFMGRSLWEDETHLALNIIHRGYIGLAKPLDYIQGAPVFFLFSVKTFAKIFGYGELSLRATTFIPSILTLPLYYFIVLELTKKRIIALIGFLVFTTNIALIYYSSELKPYGVDVSVYLIMVYFAVSQNYFVAKYRRIALAIAGCVSILFSSTAFIILFCIACCMFYDWYKAKKINRQDIKVLVAWACVFCIYYFLFIYHHPSWVYQQQEYAFAFCPVNIFSRRFSLFMQKTIDETFFTMLLYVSKVYMFAYVLLLIFIVAVGYLFIRKKYKTFLLICLPVLIHLLLSMLKLYPFWFRLILYLLPCFIFLMALGVYLIARFLAERLHFVIGAIFVIVCCGFFIAPSVRKFPEWGWGREIKPTLDFVNNKIPRTAHVYILDPVHAYMYYYFRGYVKDSIYKEMPWFITPQEYREFVANEKSDYILFYGTIYQWGYADVLKSLKDDGLVVKEFEYTGYGVRELRPYKPLIGLDILNYNCFITGKSTPILDDEGTQVMPIWGNEDIVSKPVFLPEGKYNITIISKGTPVNKIFPHNNLFINGNKLGNFSSTHLYGWNTFLFTQRKDTAIVISIDMDNDAMANDEDRNTFVRDVYVYKAGKQ